MSTTSTATERPKWVAPFFHSADQQLSAANLGMWLFLAQEILFFAGLFMAYIAYRWMYPDTWLSAAEVLDKNLGAANTVVLLTSSLTMVFAVRELEMNRIKQSVMYLWITIGCACVFLVVKYFEYSHKFHLGIFPGGNYASDTVEGMAGLFFGIYFAATGLHALHVIIGIGLLAWLAFKVKNRKVTKENYALMENIGLYWHLVDLVWIFLFPMLYLVK